MKCAERLLVLTGWLFLAACGSLDQVSAEPAARSPAMLAQWLGGKTWSLISLDGQTVEVAVARTRPTLGFDPLNKHVSGLAGVNRFRGTYTLDGPTLKFGPLLATKMAGPPELNALEARYLRALEAITGWQQAGADLELLAGGEVRARLRVMSEP